MLLTSSQVSVAVSSGVVVFFTAALFLSGYVIQQRTMREIRASILRPRKRPEQLIFLPDRFKKMTTELEDGSIVAVDMDDYRPAPKQQTIIEIAPTLPDDRAKGYAQGGDARSGVPEAKAPLVQPEDEPEQEREPEPEPEPEPKGISENDPQLGPSEKAEKTQSTGASQKQQKPISSAERRRRIKEELRLLSQGTERGYWQPRLW